MINVKKLSIGILSSVVLACALFCTANFAFANENPLQKIQDMLNNLYSGNDIVAQDVYGVVAEDYAVSSTKVQFDGGEDEAIDILKTDGSVKFHTSTADTKSASNPVWSDYYFARADSTEKETYDNIGRSHVGKNRLAPIVKKDTGKAGAVNSEGNIVIPCEYTSIGLRKFFDYAVLVNDNEWVYSIYSHTSHKKIKDISTSPGQYSTYISVYGNNYFKIPNGSYYSINEETLKEEKNISQMKGYSNADYSENYVLYSTSDNELYYVDNDGAVKKISNLSANDYFELSGQIVVVSNYKQGYKKYFTLSGQDISASIPEGYLTKYSFGDSSFQDKTMFYNSSLNKSILINPQGKVEVTLDGKCLQFNDVNFVIAKANGENTDLIAYDENYKVVKKIKTLTSCSVSSVSHFSGLDRFLFKIKVLSKVNGQVYFFDENFNEYESFSKIPYFKLADGTLIYKYTDEGSTVAKYRNASGKPIVINGYTLATYGVEGDGYQSFYENSLQRGDQDIWWAKNPAGKFGAINTAGQVKIPFIYDKVHDLGGAETVYAMGYVNGKWEFIDTTNPVPKPAPVVDSVSENSISLSWPAIEGADKYAVATQNDDGTFKTYTNSLKETKFTITGLTEGKTYKCLVQASVNGKWSDFTEEDLVSATTKSNHPKPQLVDKGDGYANIKWDAIPGATKYAIAEMENGKYRNYSTECTETTYHCDDLANGYGHNLLVQAYVNGKWTNFTKDDYLLVEIEGTTVKPTTEVESTTDHSVTLKWSHVPGAKGYAAAVRDNSGKYKSVFVGPEKLTATIEGLTDSASYDCLTQANIYGAWSAFTEKDFVTATTKGNRPVPREVDKGDGYVNIVWDAIPNATKYAIAEMENGKYRNYTTEWTGTSYKCDNLANGYGHYILVQAYVDGKWSPFNKDNYLLVDIDGPTKKPTTKVDSTTDNSVSISWNQVPGAKEYAVAVRDNDGKYKSVYLPVVDGKEYPSKATITGLKDGYNYKAIVQCKIYGAWSSFTESDMVDAKTTSNRPAPKQTAIGDGYADIAWDAIPNATAYAIAEMENGKYRNYTTEWTGTTYHCDNLANGYDHYILVQAFVNGAWTQFDKSNYLTVHPEGATKPTTTVSATTENSIALSWAKVAGATEYAAAVRDASGKYHSVYTGADATSATITGLTPNTNYKAIVQCKIYGAWSSFTEAEMKDAKTYASLAPVAVYSGAGTVNPKLTFYYDKKDHSAEGEVFLINNTSEPSWISKNTSCKTVEFDSSFANFKPVSTAGWFSPVDTVGDYSPLENIIGISNLNTSNVTDMSGMFYRCKALTSLDLSSFDTANVNGMSAMFYCCYNLRSLDVSSFNTSNVKSMAAMFGSCSSLSNLDVSSFNTSKVTSMVFMFASCRNLTALDVSHFSTSNVTLMNNMFAGCVELSTIDLSSFDTRNVTDMYNLFSGCSKLTSVDIHNFNISKVTKMDCMFWECILLSKIYCNSNWSAGSFTSNDMFENCVNLPNFNSAKVDKTYAYPNDGTTGYFTAKA